jgi:hypothetical protein
MKCSPLALLMLGCACGPTLVFTQQPQRVEVPTPPMLEGYAGAEICSGRNGDVRRIRWWIVPGTSFTVELNGVRHSVWGYADGRDIYLAESKSDRTWLARHEALHTLGYDGRHDPAVFQTRCKADWPTTEDSLT